MAEDRIQGNSVRRLLYVDYYELSFYHSPLFDLTKPFRSGVFFGTLHADCAPDLSRVEISIKRGMLVLRLHNTDRSSSRGILEIERRNLIEPLLLHSPGVGPGSKAGVEILSDCLFTSALLPGNLSAHPQGFFVSLYHAAKLS